MNFITQFIKGNWLGKARLYTFNPKKMKVLLLQLSFIEDTHITLLVNKLSRGGRSTFEVLETMKTL